MNNYFGNDYRNSPPFSLRPVPPCGTTPLSPVNTSNPPGGGRLSENNASKFVQIAITQISLVLDSVITKGPVPVTIRQ